MIFALATNRKHHQTGWLPAARTRRFSFARIAARRAALWLFSARSTTGQRAGWTDVALLEGDCASYSLRQRGALRRRKCYWHLIFCADFTMSAPLGSQSGASLSRRSLSSPISEFIIPTFSLGSKLFFHYGQAYTIPSTRRKRNRLWRKIRPKLIGKKMIEEKPKQTLTESLPASSPDGSFVRLERLSKSFQEGGVKRPVLDAVSLELNQGQIAVILGKSGSGKTTLLNLVGGIDRADSGDIYFDGLKLTALNDLQLTLFRRVNIGFIFQFFNLIPTLTVWENLVLPLELKSRLDPPGKERAAALLEEVGLADRRSAFPDRLSGGEQQRVAIARALVHDPGLVLADEPTGNLDEETGGHILSLLESLTRRSGKTVLMVTHSAEASAIADKVFRMHNGRLQEQARDE